MLDFIDKSPSPHYVVKNIESVLQSNGFQELSEKDKWVLSPGKYYVKRSGTSVIAFHIPSNDFKGYNVIASHSDSPAFKVKIHPEMKSEDAYIKLNVEKYGGMILSTWFDRPLSVSGMIAYKTADGVGTKLVNIERDLLVIPSLAIHMDRDSNKGHEISAQKEMLPLFSMISGKEKAASGSFLSFIAKETGIEKDDILDFDLYLYNREKSTSFGENGEFVLAPRLDDLGCAYTTLEGFISAVPKKTASVYAIFNNEEVGSSTKQGAASDFLEHVLKRINAAFQRSEEEYMMSLQNSFMVSADNAHAVHPNYSEKADPVNKPKLNGGVVIKYNANQKYTTDSISAAIFKHICDSADVPVQEYVNNSDIAGGSTLGSIATSRVSMKSVDIGLPQLSMHSAMETGGMKDIEYMIKAAEKFYSSDIESDDEGNYKIG